MSAVETLPAAVKVAGCRESTPGGPPVLAPIVPSRGHEGLAASVVSTVVGYRVGPRGESQPIVTYTDPLVPPLVYA
jgi:hypothetical protein